MKYISPAMPPYRLEHEIGTYLACITKCDHSFPRINQAGLCRVEGYLACCEALSVLDNREMLPKIKSPTLVIAGRHDMSTTVAAGEYIRSQIPGASMTILDAAHISNVEQPHAFTDAVVGFLTQR